MIVVDDDTSRLFESTSTYTVLNAFIIDFRPFDYSIGEGVHNVSFYAVNWEGSISDAQVLTLPVLAPTTSPDASETPSLSPIPTENGSFTDEPSVLPTETEIGSFTDEPVVLPTDTPSGSKGAIIGGIIGGVVALAAVGVGVAAFCILWRQRRATMAGMGSWGGDPEDPTELACDPDDTSGWLCDPENTVGWVRDPENTVGLVCDPEETGGLMRDPENTDVWV
jgi:hypothetical protein